MSWNVDLVGVRDEPKGTVAKMIDSLELSPSTVAHATEHEALDEMQAQLKAAKAAAAALIKSGCLGELEGGSYDVHLRGHANKGHALTPGWSHDWVDVSIGRQ